MPIGSKPVASANSAVEREQRPTPVSDREPERGLAGRRGRGRRIAAQARDREQRPGEQRDDGEHERAERRASRGDSSGIAASRPSVRKTASAEVAPKCSIAGENAASTPAIRAVRSSKSCLREHVGQRRARARRRRCRTPPAGARCRGRGSASSAAARAGGRRCAPAARARARRSGRGRSAGRSRTPRSDGRYSFLPSPRGADEQRAVELVRPAARDVEREPQDQRDDEQRRGEAPAAARAAASGRARPRRRSTAPRARSHHVARGPYAPMNGGCGTPSSVPRRVQRTARRRRSRPPPRRQSTAPPEHKGSGPLSSRRASASARSSPCSRSPAAARWPPPSCPRPPGAGRRRADRQVSDGGADVRGRPRRATGSSPRGRRRSSALGARPAASRSAVALLDRGAKVAVLCGRERVLELYDARTLKRLGRARRRDRADRARDRRRATSSTSSTRSGDALLVFHLRRVRADPPRPPGRRTVRDRVRPRALGLWITLTAATGRQLRGGIRPVLRDTLPSIATPARSVATTSCGPATELRSCACAAGRARRRPRTAPR